MDPYHFHGPEHLRGRAAATVFVITWIFLWVATVLAFAPINVTVDGVTHRLPAGTTAADIIRSGLASAHRGDLMSVAGGVAAIGKGLRPMLIIGGEKMEPTARLTDGAVALSVRGADVTESLVTTLVAIPVPIEETGKGPDRTIESLGAAGLAVARMGVVSHSITESRTIVAASPMRARRHPIDAQSRVVALTFDDGPWPGQTERILDILKSEGIHAAFFMMGVRVRMHPDLARRVAAEGHTIGNHTQTHPTLTRVSPDVVRAQMAVADAIILDTTGVKPRFFRAPTGAVNGVVRAEAAALGERVVHWTVDPKDWSRPSTGAVIARVVSATRPGAVILMHDGGGDRSQTIEALPEIIRVLREQGFRFLTLDEMYGGE